MAIKFKTDRRIESNQADAKANLRKNWYAIGTDGKKSYITTIENALISEARKDAKSWAKSHSLTLQVLRVTK